MARDLLGKSVRVPGRPQLGLMVRLLLGPFLTARIVGRLGLMVRLLLGPFLTARIVGRLGLTVRLAPASGSGYPQPHSGEGACPTSGRFSQPASSAD
jgi:hypothetical protein